MLIFMFEKRSHITIPAFYYIHPRKECNIVFEHLNLLCLLALWLWPFEKCKGNLFGGCMNRLCTIQNNQFWVLFELILPNSFDPANSINYRLINNVTHVQAVQEYHQEMDCPFLQYYGLYQGKNLLLEVFFCIPQCVKTFD